MASVTLRDIGKTFNPGGPAVLQGMSLHVEDGSTMVILGPSGCGKSTTLRIIAGLETPSSGSVLMDGKPVEYLLPGERNVAMVFQDFTMYPHMNVRDNLSFGLRLRGTPRHIIEERIHACTRILGVGDLLDRMPHTLSGGQRQRIALGRAIVRQPSVLLLDEPLSHLDAPLRAELRRELALLQRQLAVTMIMVTHDQSEAMALGQKVCVLDQGRIQQVGSPAELLKQPANIVVASFLGQPPMNIFKGQIIHELGQSLFKTALSSTALTINGIFPAGPAYLGLRPEQLQTLAYSAEEKSTTLFGIVEWIESNGESTWLHMRTEGFTFSVKTPSGHGHKTGDRLQLVFDPESAMIFDSHGVRLQSIS